MIPRYRGARLTGGRPPSQRKPPKNEITAVWIDELTEDNMARSVEDAKTLIGAEPWINGEPYYCAVCDMPISEISECYDKDNGVCRLETKAAAIARRVKHLAGS